MSACTCIYIYIYIYTYIYTHTHRRLLRAWIVLDGGLGLWGAVVLGAQDFWALRRLGFGSSGLMVLAFLAAHERLGARARGSGLRISKLFVRGSKSQGVAISQQISLRTYLAK